MERARIYVASSWRNEFQQGVVLTLRAAGFEVYDFKHPAPGNDGFHWRAIEPNWEEWTPEQFRANLSHPIAESGYAFDKNALDWCEACVMVLPCGRSASLEMGYCIGKGKKTVILLQDGEPELMFKLADHICVSLMEVLDVLGVKD